MQNLNFVYLQVEGIHQVLHQRLVGPASEIVQRAALHAEERKIGDLKRPLFLNKNHRHLQTQES